MSPTGAIGGAERPSAHGTSPIASRTRQDCRFDALALGEVMLRLDPGDGRIRTARSFQVWEGGGEYNVVRGLRRCFGLRTAIATALGTNDLALLVEDLVLQGGVDTAYIRRKPSDGIGRRHRTPLNFTERGFGVRGGIGISDRAHSAGAALGPGDFDWDDIFGADGVRWLHTGGIFAALSDSTAEVAAQAMTAAHRHGTAVSYDLNFRASLWQERGGRPRAQEVNRSLVGLADVLLGNEEDLTAGLGVAVPHMGPDLRGLDPRRYEEAIAATTGQFPNLRVVATTLREVHSATVNDWGALAWSGKDGFVRATPRAGLHIYDRVGGGDSFASGLIFGLLDGRGLQESVELGAAHGALAMTTAGDASTATLAEVEHLARGGGARVTR